MNYLSDNLNTNTKDDLNKLIDASESGDIRSVQALLDAGIDANASNVSGSTALHWAARRGYTEITKLLLSKGAEVNLPNDFFHTTALHFACRRNYSNIVSVLLLSGANLNAKNNIGETPIDFAAPKLQEKLNLLKPFSEDLLCEKNLSNILLILYAIKNDKDVNWINQLIDFAPALLLSKEFHLEFIYSSKNKSCNKDIFNITRLFAVFSGCEQNSKLNLES